MVAEPTASNWFPPVQRYRQLDELIGAEVWLARDDLLPFPLSGNKVRKLYAEIGSIPQPADVYITNGGVESNHCRTLAFIAAQRGAHAHVVLHGENNDSQILGLQFLNSLGASFDVGSANTIAARIESARQAFVSQGKKVQVIPGGGHSPEGAIASRDAARHVFSHLSIDHVFVASGTGATQGGLIAASAELESPPDIVGVSVARNAERGISAVKEAADWAGNGEGKVIFLDHYRAGGYGLSDSVVKEAVKIGWQCGIPLDPTYTGKAFSALLDWSRRGKLSESVLFWHTGGLSNWLSSSSIKE